MAKLPKSLIKKYGISKKAWQVYKNRNKKKKKRKSPTIKSRSRKRTTKKMAKKKRTYRRKSRGLKPSQILIGGGIYGALRSYLDGAIKPLTSKIPLGTITDEAALFTLGYFAHKKFRDKTIKSAAMAAMSVEAARMGEAFRDGSAFGAVSSNGAGTTFGTFG